MIRVEDCRIMLGEDGLELIVNDVLDVYCAIGISLRVGSRSIYFIVINFFVEEELEFRESLSGCRTISPIFAGDWE